MAHRLRTLGGVSLSNDSCVLGGAASQRRRLALLSLIAASGDRGVTRDRLIGLLWPDSEPAKARQVLTQWLHLIRHDLGDGELFQGTSTLRLNPSHISSDVGELHDAMDSNDAERAAALYAGPFLDGFYLNGAPEFERWAEEERGRLAARMRSTYEALTRRAMTIEAWAAAVQWSERLVGLDPVDAGAAITYMKALAGAGERARAIRHAGVHAHMMRDEMETEPDEAVESLAAQLRSRPRAIAKNVMPEAIAVHDVGVPTRQSSAMVNMLDPPAGHRAPARSPPRWVTRERVSIAAIVAAAAVVLAVARDTRSPVPRDRRE